MRAQVTSWNRIAALCALVLLPGGVFAHQRIVGSLPQGTPTGALVRYVSTFRIEQDPQSRLYFARCSVVGKNGRMDVNLLLDSGCEQLILSDIVVDSLGLQPDEQAGAGSLPAPGSSSGDVNRKDRKKTASQEPVVVTELHVGSGLHFKDIYAYRWNTRVIRSLGGEQVDGIIGLYPFGLSSLQIDFQKGFATARHPSALTAEEMKAAGMDGAIELPIETDEYEVYVNADFGSGHTERMRVDTGAVHSGISAQMAKTLGVTPISKGKMTTLYGLVQFARAKIPSLSIGPLKLGEVLVEYPVKKQPEFPALLGQDILTRYRIVLDIPNKKLYLKPVERTPLTPSP